MNRVLRHSLLRSSGSLRIALPILIVLLGAGGYLLTSRTISSDRDAAAARRAQSESVQTQEVLGRTRAYVAGLGNVLAGEPEADQARFARLAGGTAASVGLGDVLWVQSVPDSERGRYERRLGAPIRRVTPSGRFERAPPAHSYLPATFTSATRPELRPGVDVSNFRGLAAAIGNRTTVFSVGASTLGSLGDEPGFYLLQAAGFGRGPDSRGFLVAFVPRGWFATALPGNPRRLAIAQDGRRIEGEIDSADAAASFETLGRRWRIDVAREAPSGLQSTLPWLALAWPVAVALIVFLVVRAIMLRRRAERDVERIFDLSLDLLASTGFDGYFKRVNPAFERTLGYSNEELLSRRYSDFVHPDDLKETEEVFAAIVSGEQVVEFENRFICADGSVRRLQWSTRVLPDEGLMYSVARDVTDSRRAERQFEEVFNLSPDLLGISGLDGYLQRVNPAFEKAFGYSSEELLSRPLLDLGHPEDRPLARDAFTRLARGEDVPRFENRNIRADGSILWLEWSSRPLSEEGLIYGAARDITDRKRSEEQLRQAQEMVEASRDELRMHAEDEAALRRVATLVARGASPTDVLDAVAAEVSGLLDTDITGLMRYEPDGAATILAVRSALAPPTFAGTRVPSEGDSATATMLRAGLPVRLEDDVDAAGSAVIRAVRKMGFCSGVAAPIRVEGRLWGGVFAAWTEDEPPLADADSRMAEFTELVATAIANAESRGELAASRARVVAASAEERRRVVRDLHDGAQQRLVHAVITLKLALRALGTGDSHAEGFVTEALDHTEQANFELRELVHGILPGVLTSGGLRAGVEELVSRASLPVAVDVSATRFPPAVEATAYFVVSEALTNAVKHSGAHGAQVAARVDNGALRVEVRDDGVGGADPRRGSGLTGLQDRVEALGGTIEITSPAGRGTSLVAEVPIEGD
jgi:PAS domain S-box-containing protein